MPDLRAEQSTAGSAFRVLLIETEQTEGRRLRAVLEHCYGKPFLLTETGSVEDDFEALPQGKSVTSDELTTLDRQLDALVHSWVLGIVTLPLTMRHGNR
jgi:hypothetical protein